jgi:hypothetical protein
MAHCLYCKSYWDCNKDPDNEKECNDFVEGIDDSDVEIKEIEMSSSAWVYQDLMR